MLMMLLLLLLLLFGFVLVLVVKIGTDMGDSLLSSLSTLALALATPGPPLLPLLLTLLPPPSLRCSMYFWNSDNRCLPAGGPPPPPSLLDDSRAFSCCTCSFSRRSRLICSSFSATVLFMCRRIPMN
jgi:hypothetical protein